MTKLFAPILLVTIFFAFFGFISQADAVTIQNPLRHDTFQGLMEAIINFVFTLSLYVAPLMLIIAGAMFILAAGNPEQITKAKNLMIYVLIGLVIVVAARGLIEALKVLFGVS